MKATVWIEETGTDRLSLSATDVPPELMARLAAMLPAMAAEAGRPVSEAEALVKLAGQAVSHADPQPSRKPSADMDLAEYLHSGKATQQEMDYYYWKNRR